MAPSGAASHASEPLNAPFDPESAAKVLFAEFAHGEIHAPNRLQEVEELAPARMRCNVGVVSVVPSPYQRDLFAALARRPEINLRVFYLEAAAPDSPWPEKPLADFERILPGFWFPLGAARCHVNWRLGEVRRCGVIILNSLMSLTAQRLMRIDLRGRPWIFWGERLSGNQAGWHGALTHPLHRAEAIVGIGSRARADYEARFPGPRHFCIPYHCALEPFSEAAHARHRAGKLTFLFCGQMIARKGLDLLLDAFSRLVRRHEEARLLLVGRKADLPRMIGTLPSDVRAHVEYAGFQPPEKLPAVFARADVFVLPSRYDGWGVVVNQALGAGLPIICSDAVGAGHDLIEPEVNGIRFESGNIDALEQAMERFAEDRSLAAVWGKASHARAAAWTPERGAERWIEALRQLCLI